MEVYNDGFGHTRHFRFLGFGNDDTGKQRKQQELNQEYQKFKALDEERFRNRFADKKATESQNQGHPPSMVQTSSNSPPPPNINDQVHEPPPPSPIEVIMAKLDCLQQTVQSLRSPRSNTATVMTNDTIPFLVKYTPNTLADQTLLMSEAETRIQQLESLVATLRQSKDFKSDLSTDMSKPEEMDSGMPIIFFTRLDVTLNESSENPYERNKTSVGRFINLHGSINSRERLRRKEKENYARELQIQIEEQRKLRKLHHQKLVEEDRRKLEEMKSCGTLGQKLEMEQSAPPQQEQQPSIFPDANASTSPTIQTNGSEKNYTRGGNGIFGQPLTEAQKQANSKYREELMQQIEDRKRREEALKRREKEDDEQEAARLAAEERRKTDVPNSDGVKQAVRLQTSPKNVKEPIETPAKAPECGGNTRKHSVCLQTSLGKTSPKNRQKPTRVIRRPPPQMTTKKALNYDELTVQLNQLKLELTSEKLRLQQTDTMPEKNVHVYDPRIMYLPVRNTVLRDSFLGRPVKVRRSIVSPVTATKNAGSPLRCPPVQKNSTFIASTDESFEVDRRCSLDCARIQSNSRFLPSEEVPRTPSLGSLNLDELNRRNQQRLKHLIYDDNIYRNEEPIIRDFMREETRRRFNE